MELYGLLNYALFMGVFIGIYALLALGLNIQWGFAGLFNAGIAGFFAVGAYTSAILTSAAAEGRIGGFELPVIVGWFGAMGAAALIAWPIGKICLRFRSDYLAIATIGIAEIIRLVIKSEAELTNSARGITGLPRPFGDLDYMASQAAYLGIVLVVLAIAYVLVERQFNAPWGRMMRAIRDNEDAARAMGKNIEYRRLEAFIFGAALMGLGGALFAHFNRSITPEAIDPMVATFLVWIMLILGGSGNNRGAILGAAVVWIIWSVSEIATDQLPHEYAVKAKYIRLFLIGLLLQLVLRFRPEGILPEPLRGDLRHTKEGNRS
ncbi:amino acid/amide ABC transporter membrane protein 2, HAAT family (TC 3.A.1.4.-) [Roseibium hamelinense]|uniref:Amino acid/amide ABC transporter membrane protein 2, HAAT family (TC 3.A.1.4.-) n=1 Tax=Roseibium hamelinense TaxID=150831 RepID=A0A562T1D0_9HYPH|nr:branched-chain amino acid ABC transporter permease [Roseibium hamelinense]MTI44499.1 branched-chain amino acid ABC transporter permease [Roseibium hamelinense]TWI87467.1 amino acid/amide ABC transporter membrane protein 2, HAAT family (TC 3.A.1.4.-) [Roseibium hamelinense]